MLDFYGEPCGTLKANLHTHTTRSDGQYTPDEVVDLYRRNGYGALALTDHYVVSRVSELDGGDMVLLNGLEMHPQGPRGTRWHILALGIPEDFRHIPELPAREAIDSVRDAGGICLAAHPYWCGHTAAEVMGMDGFLGLEVYNTSTRYIGKAYNMQIWDEMLDAGARYAAIAVDDTHRERDFGKGWIMAACREKTPGEALRAIRDGRFYASQGPEFTALRFANGIFEAEFSPCVEAVVLTNGPGGFGLVDGEYRRISFDAGSLKPGAYLRCQIRDAAGRYAWSNPVYLS